jgi:hypothetical protein
VSLISTILILSLSFFLTPAQDRDLSGYEKMEHTVDSTKESSEPYIAKEREFIWDCWSQKRKCFSHLKVELKDAAPTIIKVFIEPNEKGVWNAVYQIDSQLLDKNGKPKGKPINAQFSLHEVVRVEPTDSVKKIREIPKDAVRTADSYKIYFKSNQSAMKQGVELLFNHGISSGLIF